MHGMYEELPRFRSESTQRSCDDAVRRFEEATHQDDFVEQARMLIGDAAEVAIAAENMRMRINRAEQDIRNRLRELRKGGFTGGDPSTLDEQASLERLSYAYSNLATMLVYAPQHGIVPEEEAK